MRSIGQYQVFEELGRGAGGIVYRALDPAVGRSLAIKELRLSQLAPGEIAEARQRFVREAQAVGNLRHDNIVTLYQFLEEEGSLYLVMEYVPGGSLLQLMKSKHSFSIAEALGIVRQVAAALDRAHASGIVHRDIKPGNILVSDDRVGDLPVVKVTDFGIARVSSETLTMTGVSLGTPAYMAPEQIEGSNVDARADQFSLAVVAYQLLAGKLPFAGSSDQSLMFQIVNTEPLSLLEARPNLPVEADRVIRRAMAKNPDQRFSDCSEFINALDHALFPPAPLTRRTLRSKPNTGRWFFAAGGAVVALAAALYFGWASRDGSSRETDREAYTPGTPPERGKSNSLTRASERESEPRGGEKSPASSTATRVSPFSRPEPVAYPDRLQEVKNPVFAQAGLDANARGQILSAIQAWASAVRSGDIGRYEEAYADRLTPFYGHPNAPVSEAVQSFAGELKKYANREFTITNPAFRVVGGDEVQVDYDKEYRYSGPGEPLNQGKVRASLRLRRRTTGPWMITAEFDRKICWSTQMRDPLMQSPPGVCP